jgi:hypothetical protein
MADAQKLKEELINLLKEELADLWEEEDAEFLEELAADVVREKLLAVTAGEPEEHETNLRHLAAQFQGEIVRKQIRLNRQGRRIFARIVATVIKTIALSALRLE